LWDSACDNCFWPRNGSLIPYPRTRLLAILAKGLPPPTLPNSMLRCEGYKGLSTPKPYKCPVDSVFDFSGKRVTIWKNMW
jgi:hypothetical protein